MKVAAGGTVLAGMAAVCGKRCARSISPEEPAEASLEPEALGDESSEHEPALAD